MFLLVLFIWAAAEIAALVVVAGQIGWLLAIVLFLGISTAGPWLIRRAGIGTINHARERLNAGASPDRELLDGVVALLGGVLVVIPGFIGDAIGLLLLLRPVRHLVIGAVGRWLAHQVGAGTLGAWGAARSGRFGTGGPIVDAPTHDPGSATHDGAPATEHEIQERTTPRSEDGPPSD
jgi:UPF0716 protein FxsA